MPVRSLNGSVFRWPDAAAVHQAVRAWAGELASFHAEVRRVGYIGSYARGDWGVGSDVDLVVVVDRCDEPLERRGLRWDRSRLPVPADLLIYTEREWSELTRSAGRFARALRKEAVWVHPAER